MGTGSSFLAIGLPSRTTSRLASATPRSSSRARMSPTPLSIVQNRNVKYVMTDYEMADYQGKFQAIALLSGNGVDTFFTTQALARRKRIGDSAADCPKRRVLQYDGRSIAVPGWQRLQSLSPDPRISIVRWHARRNRDQGCEDL